MLRGAGFFRIILGSGCTKSMQRVTFPHMPAPGRASHDPAGQLQFGHEANSGFRLRPGAYTLAYSPKRPAPQ